MQRRIIRRPKNVRPKMTGPDELLFYHLHNSMWPTGQFQEFILDTQNSRLAYTNFTSAGGETENITSLQTRERSMSKSQKEIIRSEWNIYIYIYYLTNSSCCYRPCWLT